MDSEICLHNATVLTGYSEMKNCAVLIKQHKIIDVFNETRFAQKKFKETVKFIDVNGAYIAPGFMDTHIHGIEGWGTDDLSARSILKMSEVLPKYGVTSFIPTLYSAPKEQLIKGIRAIVEAIGQEKGAKILGIHLEGPFISPDRLGVQTPDSLSPVNIDLMNELLDAAEGHIVNMTVAPELKNMRELALYCVSKGIVLQAGHTNATYEQMVEGMQARILHVTHLFNAMSRMHHRDPGAVGAVFIHPELSCEIIADGIHINPNIIKFLLQCKPLDKLVLVTDSLKPTKQKTLPLIANGEEVYLDKCFLRKSDDVIAGSALTMIDGVKNLVNFGLNLEQAIRMAAANPAVIMRQEHLGLIAPGYDADLVVFDKKFNTLYTIINGKLFEKGKVK
ncbi:MAG: N-acetylglucosamine-6-phosphate deacetylase [Alphaproteobacteria bacterium]|nr:N-acetylglucosamine-6-phosphate deacetylase [Alphaproteobacteria bacterium]